MAKDLVVIEQDSNFKELAEYLPEYKGMLEKVKAGVPEVHRATSLFGKQQSQFMDNMLTVSKPTPIRNLRQILAEMNKTRMALSEAYSKCKIKDIERRKLVRDAEAQSDELERELLLAQAEEKDIELGNTKNYIGGAIRKLANYQAQYDSICEHFGVKDFSEIDYEAEEERYHIMTSFEQALNAARSRQGVIDEGNLIYFTQIGINGAVAQKLMLNYLQHEQELMSKNEEPTYDLQLKFLNDMAAKFKGCSIKLAQHKGMTTVTQEAALERGDTRLLDE